jgi:transcription termination factor NusA
VDGNELKEDLTRRIGGLLQDESFDLWDLEFASQAGATVVRVFVDRPSGVTLQDCAYWNKKIGRYLEAEDVFRGRYVLEVGSPGLDRTLVRPEHYARFLGANVELKLHDPHEGRRTFHGEIRAAGPGHGGHRRSRRRDGEPAVRVDPEGAVSRRPMGRDARPGAPTERVKTLAREPQARNMNYELMEAMAQIAREKSVDKAILIETLEAGLLSAGRKRFGPSANIEVRFDDSSGKILMRLKRTVVEDADDLGLEVDLAEAKGVDPDIEIGQELIQDLSLEELGRNAIAAAKQVLVQRVREAERERIYEDYHDRVGEMVRGTVQQVDRGNIYVKLDRSEGVLPPREQIARDRYHQGDHIKAYIIAVDKLARGPQIILSRTHPEFLRRLFEAEVPEVAEKIIEIRGIAREPGSRAKVSVLSNDDKIDAVGACVGIKGSRVQAYRA